MAGSSRSEIAGRAGKVWVVTKADAGMGLAAYIIGVFFNEPAALAACVGPGTFTVLKMDPNRVYPRGTLLDCVMIDNITTGSLRTRP